MYVCALVGRAYKFLLPGGKAEQYSYKSETEDDGTQSGSETYEPEITAIG